MAFIDDFAELLTDSAVWEPLSGRDDYGAPSYGAPTTFAARLTREHKMVRDLQGDEVLSTGQLWLKGAPAVGPEDRITLSDGTQPELLSIERFQDEAGANGTPSYSHTKVYFR